MKTYYDQRRIYFHNIRFSGVEEERLQERRKKFRFESVSDFISTLDFRMLRVQKDFQEAIKCPGVDLSSSMRRPTGSASSRPP